MYITYRGETFGFLGLCTRLDWDGLGVKCLVLRNKRFGGIPLRKEDNYIIRPQEVAEIIPEKPDMFTAAYLRAVGDLTMSETLQAAADCEVFQEKHAQDIVGSEAQAGQDFWLTRSRQGPGFRAGWGARGERLRKTALSFG